MIRNTKKALLDLRAFEKLFLSQILGSDIDVSAVIIDNTPEVVMDAYIINRSSRGELDNDTGAGRRFCADI